VKKQKRAGERTLHKIAPLLQDLRRFDTLDEKRPGVFFFRKKEFIHFHKLPDAIVADIFLPNERLRLPVTTRSEQMDVMDRIWNALDQP